jgi:hypothetical protein
MSPPWFSEVSGLIAYLFADFGIGVLRAAGVAVSGIVLKSVATSSSLPFGLAGVSFEKGCADMYK